MSRYRKCLICGEFIVGEDGVPYKGRYAHQNCFNGAMKMLQKNKADKMGKTAENKSIKKSKPKAELKGAISEEEYADKKRFFQYLRDLSPDNEIGAKAYVLTEDYIKKYSFSYVSMHQTLTYMNEIIDKELHGDVVGLIPYYHDSAKKYFQSIEDIVKKNEKVDVSNMYKHKTIVVRPKQKKIKQLDIETIKK